MYAKGENISRDYFEAVKWFRKAADQGYAPAQLNLFGAYIQGKGVPKDEAEAVVESMRRHERGREAVIIGRVVADHPGVVTLATGFGGERVVDMPVGEQLPRIC